MSGLSRIWAIALVASLAANFFVAGLLISSWAFDGPRISGRQFGVERFRGSDQPDRIVGQIIERFDSEIRPHIQEVNAASQAVTEALAADPFDEQALIDALDHLRLMTGESQQAMHSAMVQSVLAMSPSQRHELAAASKRSPGRLLLGR